MSQREIVTAFVQAGEKIGLGHLHRTALLAQSLEQYGIKTKLCLDADDYGRENAQQLGLEIIMQDDADSEVAIIDAVTLPETLRIRVEQFSKRILISPVFDRPDLATHVLVRAESPGLSNALSEHAILIVDARFGLITVQEASPKPWEFDQLVVGICLSGGADAPYLNELVETIASTPGVVQVLLLSRQAPSLSTSASAAVIHAPHRSNPWHFLDSANVFVGGDGLMLYEAVARGLPTFSFSRTEHAFKNGALVEAGCAKLLSPDKRGIDSLVSELENLQHLKSMCRNACNAFPPGSVDALTHQVFKILKD